MYCTRKITDAVTWVGGCDRRLSLFENLFPVPSGVAYNSYLILDEKTALLDTVDSSISRQFLENVLHTLDSRPLDYLVINHMEPDHCANISELLLRFPGLKIVGNAKTLTFIRQFYDMDLEGRTITIKEKDTLPLGRHTLHFYLTPMVHWPEVMMTYEESENILFSADAFGCFGALNGNIFIDELDYTQDWLAEARRYYGNIVGKYGPQVQAALKKLSALEIAVVCPLHGPIWRSDIDLLLIYTPAGAATSQRSIRSPCSTAPCTAIRKTPSTYWPPALQMRASVKLRSMIFPAPTYPSSLPRYSAAAIWYSRLPPTTAASTRPC